MAVIFVERAAASTSGLSSHLTGSASGRFAMIKSEHPTKSLAADDLTEGLADVIDGIDAFVIEPLVIAIGVIMFEIGS